MNKFINELNDVLNAFGLTGIKNARRINSGHINQTFLVSLKDKEYVVQRINGRLFTRPENIMVNIDLVCRHIRYPIRFLYSGGKNYIYHNDSLWRIYEYFPDSVSFDVLEERGYIFEFGRILGIFHTDTGKMDINEFNIIIEDFHNTKKRIDKLISLTDLPCDMKLRYKNMSRYADRLAAKNLPLKITHNDVKCSNVLFHTITGKALALIDLDTVMPGYYVYDMGDGIRSGCVHDSSIDMNRLTAFCRGYFSAYSGNEPPMAEDIFLGIVCVTAELSARYLYDSLSGENYFSDKTEKQKADRGERLLLLAENTANNEEAVIKAIEAGF